MSWMYAFISSENIPPRNSDVDYRFLEAAKAGDLDTVKVKKTVSEFTTFKVSVDKIYFTFAMWHKIGHLMIRDWICSKDFKSINIYSFDANLSVYLP